MKATLVFASGRTVEIDVAPEDIESGVLVFRDTRIVTREYAFRFQGGIQRPRFEEVRVAWLTADNAPALADALKRAPDHPQGKPVLQPPPRSIERLPEGKFCENGCSPMKVKAGLCDTWNPDGTLRNDS